MVLKKLIVIIVVFFVSTSLICTATLYREFSQVHINNSVLLLTHQNDLQTRNEEVVDSILESSVATDKALYWSLTFPYMNAFYLQKLTKKESSAGFLGASTGIEFAYTRKNYISVNAAVAMDFPFFIPVPIGETGDFESERSVTAFVSLRHHNQVENFDFGYGLHVSRLFWQKQYFKDAGQPAIPIYEEMVETTGVGLSLSAHMFTSEYFKLGFLYLPSFYTFSPNRKFEYQHFASFEFGWRIPVWTFD